MHIQFQTFFKSESQYFSDPLLMSFSNISISNSNPKGILGTRFAEDDIGSGRVGYYFSKLFTFQSFITQFFLKLDPSSKEIYSWRRGTPYPFLSGPPHTFADRHCDSDMDTRFLLTGIALRDTCFAKALSDSLFFADRHSNSDMDTHFLLAGIALRDTCFAKALSDSLFC